MSENDYARLEVDKVILHSQLPPDEYDAVSRNYVDTADAGVKSYVDGKVAALVDSAPSTLNRLKEIAQALNNDANLASTLVVLSQVKAPPDLWPMPFYSLVLTRFH